MQNKISIILLLITLLSGCAQFQDMGISNQLPEKEQQIQAAHEKIAKPEPSYFRKVDGHYLSGKEVRFTEEQKLPAWFDEELTLVGPLYLNGIVDQISKWFAVPVSLAPEVTEDDDLEDTAMSTDFHGELKLFLDSVASYFGLYWKYKNGEIYFYQTDTQEFTLVASMTTTSLSSTLTNSSGSSSSSSEDSGTETASESNQSVTSSLEMAAWNEAVESIKAMLSEKGTVASNKAAGTVVVTDSPVILRRVEAYVEALNDRQARQIALNVQVFSWTSTDTRDRGVGADLVYKDITGATVKVLGSSTNSIADDAGTLKAAIIDSADNASDSLSAFYGSQLLINALRNRGKVTLIKNGSSIGMSNQPMSVNNLRHKAYFSEVSGTTSDSGNTTTSDVAQSSIVVGFSMQAIPHVLPDNRIVLEYSLILSQLNSLEEKSTGGYTLQLPDTSSQQFTNHVMLRSGTTLVLAGYSNDILSDTRRDGVLSIGSSEEKTREFVVVAIDVNDMTVAN